MNFLKKAFISIFTTFAALFLVAYLIFYSANHGHMNKPLKRVIEFYLSKNDIKAVIDDLNFKENHLIINKISLYLIDNAEGEINDLDITLNFKNLFSNSLIEAYFNVAQFSVISNNKEEIINTQINGDYSLNIFQRNILTNINLTSIKSDILTDEKGAGLPLGKAICVYKTSNTKNNPKIADCKLNFGNKASLSLNSKVTDKNIDANANIVNIPLIIYQTVEKIIPNNPVISYLREHIKQGHIQNGELSIKLDRKFLKENILEDDNLKANLHISNFEYKYHKDLTALTKVDTNVVISGAEVKFLINEAYSGNSVLSNGIMTFKWEGPLKSQFVFNATAKGEISDLVDFIPNDAYQNIKNEDIDLKGIKGNANSIIEIIIPINSEIDNSYNVTSTLTDINFNTLSNNILLQQGEAKGVFKDNQLNITGKGKINNYVSNFTYDHDMVDENNNCLLKIKSSITANNKSFGILKLMSGSAVLDFEYKKQNNNTTIDLNSNLDNLEFYIDKVAIHKQLRKKANLNIHTKLSDKGSDKNIEFNLSGDDSLKISGNILAKKDIYNISLSSINHKNTRLRGKITIDSHNLNTEIYGSVLDLSNSNMMEFLQKDGDSTRNVMLKTNIYKVLLKDNVILDNFDLAIKCDKVRCFSGFLNSNISNNGKVRMSLTAQESYEQWLIESDNAGALLKGLGMYSSMQDGYAKINLNTRRYKVKKGDIIPILDGKFYITRFALTDTPFLTRLVSFVSMPGFLSSITNNKNISFEDMNGNFSYQGSVITLSGAEAHGPFFDFTMKGNIDTNQKLIQIKGNVIPSFFFISSIVTKIPVVGKIFSKVAPYSLKIQYK